MQKKLWKFTYVDVSLISHFTLHTSYAKERPDKHVPTATKSPASTVHISMEVVWQTRGNRTVGQAAYYSVRTQLFKAGWYVYRRLLLSTDTQRWRPTQSEPSKRETFFNQQPANLQAEVRSYVLYNDNKYLYKRLIRGCLFTHRQELHHNPTHISLIFCFKWFMLITFTSDLTCFKHLHK
jgi:hypothetical protein